MVHQNNITCEWQDKRNRDYQIGNVKIKDTIIELKMEERRAGCYWVSFITKNRGTVLTEEIFSGIADVIEEFVKEHNPIQISFNGDKPIKALTYKEHLESRCPKYGYYLDERGSDEDLRCKVFTMRKIEERDNV